jgi:hypothetical protein
MGFVPILTITLALTRVIFYVIVAKMETIYIVMVLAIVTKTITLASSDG